MLRGLICRDVDQRFRSLCGQTAQDVGQRAAVRLVVFQRRLRQPQLDTGALRLRLANFPYLSLSEPDVMIALQMCVLDPDTLPMGEMMKLYLREVETVRVVRHDVFIH